MAGAEKANKYRMYDVENVEQALKAIEDDSMSINAAATLFKVPRSTLQDKLHGRTAVNCKSGPKPVLGEDLENKLATWIKDMARIGFPQRCLDLKETILQICKNEKIDYPFPETGPGQAWFKGFYRRHPDIRLKSSEHHSMGRAAVTEERIRGWFGHLHLNLRVTGNVGLLHDPRVWFNADEKPALLNADGRRFLGVRGETTQNLETGGPSKESLTVLVSYSAVGRKPPQMVVFKLKRMRASIQESIPSGWIVGKSDSGWVKGPTFLLWLEAFYAWCVQEELLPLLPADLEDLEEDSKEICERKAAQRRDWGNRIGKKVVLLVDGYAAHLTIDASIFCEERGIFYYCLYPQATHIGQPADVGAMSPLETFWGHELQKHKKKTGGRRVTKEEFTSLFNQALEQVTTATLVNSFRACGFCPLNPDAVNYHRLISYQRKMIKERQELEEREAEKARRIEEPASTSALSPVESLLSPGLIEKFQQCRKDRLPWSGAVQCQQLFDVWQQLASTEDGSPVTPGEAEATPSFVLGSEPVSVATTAAVEAATTCDVNLVDEVEQLLGQHFGDHEVTVTGAYVADTNVAKVADTNVAKVADTNVAKVAAKMVNVAAKSNRPLRNVTNRLSPETLKLLQIPESKPTQSKRRKLVNYLVLSQKFRDEKEGRHENDNEDWTCQICKANYSADTEDGPRVRWTSCDICKAHMHVHCISHVHKRRSNIVALSRKKEYPFVCESCVKEPDENLP